MRALTLIISAIGLIVLLLVIFKLRVRPLAEARVAADDWERTDELIQDRVTGRTLRVWVDPADGSRYTVAELTKGPNGGP